MVPARSPGEVDLLRNDMQHYRSRHSKQSDRHPSIGCSPGTKDVETVTAHVRKPLVSALRREEYDQPEGRYSGSAQWTIESRPSKPAGRRNTAVYVRRYSVCQGWPVASRLEGLVMHLLSMSPEPTQTLAGRTYYSSDTLGPWRKQTGVYLPPGGDPARRVDAARITVQKQRRHHPPGHEKSRDCLDLIRIMLRAAVAVPLLCTGGLCASARLSR